MKALKENLELGFRKIRAVPIASHLNEVLIAQKKKKPLKYPH